MGFDDMSAAVINAKDTLRLADNFVAKMAGMCAGRLRAGAVSEYTLIQLKKELADYDMHRKQWIDRK